MNSHLKIWRFQPEIWVSAISFNDDLLQKSKKKASVYRWLI